MKMRIGRTAIIIYAAIVILILGLVGLMFYPAFSYASTIAALPLKNETNTTNTMTPTPTTPSNVIIPTSIQQEQQQTIDVVDNGDNQIINEYFGAKRHLERLIELIEREEVKN
jgi:flagellar basal body-associated protein FliL